MSRSTPDASRPLRRPITLPFALGLLAATLVGAPAALAADHKITIKGEVMSTDMLSYRLSLPAPDWGDGLTGARAVQEAVATRTVQDNTDLLSFVGPGQGAGQWTHRYAVLALKAPNAMGQHVLGTLNDIRQACAPDTLSLQTTKATATGQPDLTLLLCGRFLEGSVPAALNGEGEVMLVVVAGDKDEAAKVWEEWRGPAFDIGNPATWPVDEKQLTKRGVALQSTVTFGKLP
jgi:hypothetical protein